jgi:hypothetical protein
LPDRVVHESSHVNAMNDAKRSETGYGGSPRLSRCSSPPELSLPGRVESLVSAGFVTLRRKGAPRK